MDHPLAYPPSTYMPQNSIAQAAIPPIVPVNQLPMVTQPYLTQLILGPNLKAMVDKINEFNLSNG